MLKNIVSSSSPARVSGAPLTVKPSFLLVDENWPVSDTLPVTICGGSGVQIIAGDPTRFFTVVSLNASCSTLRLNKELDADIEGPDGSVGESFSLVLQGLRRARATLEIQVVDVNDNPPQFISAPAVISVPEKTPSFSPIATIRTRDADTGVSGMARFSVDNDMFTVDKAKCRNKECTTTLRLAKALDFESQRVHHVVIMAEDGNPHSNRTLTAAHTITIHVTDENEYSMEANEYLDVDADSGAVRIKKMLPANLELKLKVTAKEDGVDGMETVEELRVHAPKQGVIEGQVSGDLCNGVVYSAKIKENEADFEQPLVIRLSKPTDPSTLRIEGGYSAFAVDSEASTSTEIRIVPAETSLVDYEKRKAFEIYLTSPYGRCQVNIEVLDVNDNAPRCIHDTFTFYVTENHKPTILGEVKAIDIDSDQFSPITYTILGDGSELFAISELGEFRSVSPIDREEHDSFDLVVRATDAGGKWTDCPGKVVVRDINDNTPTFEHPEYLIEIDEEKTLKQKLEASDPDIGENGQIVYSLENVPSGIAVEASAGIIFIGKLDRDTMDSDSVRLQLRATDRGQPPRSSVTNLTIVVRDINDNWPTFTNSRYSLVLDANISPGGVIGSVQADDADATSPNNVVRYVSEDARFRIPPTGEVIYEGDGVLSKDTSLEFRVYAVDGGEPPRNTSTVVIINEHKSSMQSEHTAQIMLNETKKRKEIIWPNTGMAGYSYEIVSAKSQGFADQDVMQWLEMDTRTGAIYTKKHPLPPSVKRIQLYISMRKGKREVPVELNINVVDTSDSTPFFAKQTFTAIVSEDSRVGAKLLQVKAESEAPLTYTLEVVTGPKDVLSIDDEGTIHSKAKLDFESFRKIEGRVVARDPDGNEATANFTIILTDVNDNRPVFVNGSVFTAHIDESAEVGMLLDLPYPLARDGDDGKFARLLYSLVGDDGHFKIDKTTSEITLASELDYETQRSHSLTVRCVDNAGEEPFNEVFASVTVLVHDVNDNPPQIHNSDLSRLTVSEDASPATVITVISVSDLDEGGKQSVFLDANHSLFRVTDEGKLILAEKLDQYAGQRLCSNLTATDSGTPPLSVSVPYCITVYPASNNHHTPLIVFPKPNSIHYFDENVDYDELLRIKLLEDEHVQDVVFKFDESFKKDWEQFTLNASGSLKPNSAFDFERKPVHELKILACRQQNCSSVHVFISVNDRNDNCPFFPSQEVKLSLMENDRSPIPRKIGRVTAAQDADFHSDNTKICYSTESPIFFFLDPTIPVLYTNQSFDREQNKEIRFKIFAYDCQLACRDPHKPSNGTITAVLKIGDVNDNFPKFTEKIYHATVIQGQASPGSRLTKVSAIDPDDESKGLQYAISGAVRTPKQSYALSDSPISIDSKTGDLTANIALQEASYTFTVTVRDGAGHEDSATVVISVVTYSHQFELLFDAPFDFISRNEKNIVKLLSNATSLTAVVDKCRQKTNFTVVLTHFLDANGEFVEVDHALRKLMSSNGTSRRELSNAFGMRDAEPVNISGPNALEAVIFGILIAVFILLVVCLSLFCRQRHSYARKLRHITAQAAAHHASLSRQPTQKVNPYYTTETAPTAVRSLAPPPPPPPLQSTEL
ncbi:hypothetical protein Q1695_004835 [Nippostrongylus brasiliensis]|nr:hypothetical protein Q1695_004835 [Nippostrongylus brasiliensis]